MLTGLPECGNILAVKQNMNELQQQIFDVLLEEQVIPSPCTYFEADKFLIGRLKEISKKIEKKISKTKK